MLRYVLIRLVQSAITLIGVSIIVFCFARLSGYTSSFLLCENGGCDEYNQKHASAYHFLGFNDPWYIHYFTFVKNASRGEFGPSRRWQDRTAMELVPLHFPASLQLAVVSIGATLLLAVPIGVISAVKKGSVLDAIGRGVARFGQSIPPFWLGIVLVLIFYVHLGWLPSSGRGGVANLVLPSIALGLFTVAAVMRLTRASMLDALDSNYIKMARIRASRSGRSRGSTASPTPPFRFWPPSRSLLPCICSMPSPLRRYLRGRVWACWRSRRQTPATTR